MKRLDLVRHLRAAGCMLDREGGHHSIFRNPANGRCTAIPRHREVKDTVAKAICDQLGISRPE